MNLNKEQLTQRVWEQLNKLQFALYATILVGLYIFFSMLNDSAIHNKLIAEINDVRHAYELFKGNKFEKRDTEDYYYLLEVTYFSNDEKKYSWFYSTHDPLKEVTRYLLAHASDIEQFSHGDSFLWGDKWISSYEIFKDDLKDSKGAPIKWHSSKYKDIEDVRILDLITNSDDLFQPKFHTPDINNLIFIGAYKRDLTTGKEKNFGAVSYIIKKRLKLDAKEISGISSNGRIVIDDQEYPVAIQDITTQNFYYTKIDGDYTYIGIINFGLGNEFGITDYASLSTTFSASRYVYNRNTHTFDRANNDPVTDYFKRYFPNLNEMFFIYYEKSRNPKISELETAIGQIIERQEKISIPLIGLSFYKAEAGKLISVILSVLLIMQMIYLRRLRDIEYQSIPLIEIPCSKTIDYLLVRLIKITMPLLANIALLFLVIIYHTIDSMVVVAIILTFISLLMFFKTYTFSKTYWILVNGKEIG